MKITAMMNTKEKLKSMSILQDDQDKFAKQVNGKVELMLRMKGNDQTNEGKNVDGDDLTATLQLYVIICSWTS